MNPLTKIPIQNVFDAHPLAHEIILRLTNEGFETVLIGGVVRDGLQAQMGRNVTFPPADVDIATAALPEDVCRLFPDRPIRRVGEEFGVLLVVAANGHPYEVATFRVESEYDGRWPGNVELVRDLARDVQRRDLTINGLAATADGDVIDLVGGVEDLVARRIATIGDPAVRFREDYLRMLRVVRFTCSVDGRIAAETAEAIRANAAAITKISSERIGEELLRILESARSARGIELLDELSLLKHILPELSACHGVEQPEEYHPEGDVFVHTVAAMRVADGFVRDPLVKLAILLHDIGKPAALQRNQGRNMGGHCAIGARMTREIGRRLRLSNAQVNRLTFLVRQHMRIADFPKMGRGKQVRFLSEGEVPDGPTSHDRYPMFFDLLQVLVADCEASAHRSSGWAPILQETLRVMDHVERVCGLQRARELIDGHDLRELGLPPGPRLGRVLDTLHDRILAGQIGSREDALEEARALILHSDPSAE